MSETSFPVSVRKLALLATLYASQGLPFGFFAQALPVLMRQQNYSLRWIGLSTLLALPWALKWLWAGIVDTTSFRRCGRRKSWILPLQALTCLTIAGVAWGGDEARLEWLIVGCFFANLFSATQDVATDGLAVEQLLPHERGLGNGVQVAAYRLGMIVGGSALLLWLSIVGWTPALLTLSGVLVLLTLPIALHRESDARSRETRHMVARESDLGTSRERGERLSREGETLSSLRLRSSTLIAWKWLTVPGSRSWTVGLVSYKFGDALATPMYKPFLVDAGLTMVDIGWMDGALGSSAGLAGSLFGGLILMRLGYRQALLGLGLLSACTTAAYVGACVYSLPTWGYVGLVVAEHFSGGMATVALFTTMMHFCRRDSEGADYTIQASLVAASTGVAGALGGFVADTWGYAALFICAAVASTIGAGASARAFLRGNARLASTLA